MKRITLLLLINCLIVSCNGSNSSNSKSTTNDSSTEINISKSDNSKKSTELSEIIKYYSIKLNESKELGYNYVAWNFSKNIDLNINWSNTLITSQNKKDIQRYGENYMHAEIYPELNNKIITSDIDNMFWGLIICGNGNGYNKILIRSNTSQENCDFESGELQNYLIKHFNLKLYNIDKDDISFNCNKYLSKNTEYNLILFEICDYSSGMGCSTEITIKLK